MGFGLEEGEARRYRAGARLWAWADSLALSLEAERHEAQTPDNGVKLDFNMRW